MFKDKLTILYITDDSARAESLTRPLEDIPEWDMDLKCLGGPSLAADVLSRENVDVTFCDTQVADQLGADIVNRLRDSGDAGPIIAVVNRGDKDGATQMIRAGADDCLVHTQLSPDSLSHSIAHAVSRYFQRQGRQAPSIEEVDPQARRRLFDQAAPLIQGDGETDDDSDRAMVILKSCHEMLEFSHANVRHHAGQLTRHLQEWTVEVLGTQDVVVFALAQLAESRDPEAGGHLRRMRAYSQILAERLSAERPYAEQIDAEFLEDFYRSTPLHDIGKVGIPDDILLKPGPLTPSEFDVIKQHTIIGADELKRTALHSIYGAYLVMATEVAHYHHERFDGTGYPAGLRGVEIPLPARIVAVADAFDAMTSRRVYKDAVSPEQAKLTIQRASGEHFDPVVVTAFSACFENLLRARAAIERGADERLVAVAFGRELERQPYENA